MKITITENQIQKRNVMEHGLIKEVVEDHVPTGREWTVDIPIENVSLKDLFDGWRNDSYELIAHLRRVLDDVAQNFRR